MRTVLLPVKAFRGAKNRLAPVLNEEERAGLACAMYRDVLAAMAHAVSVNRVVVFTADPEGARLARGAGFEVSHEDQIRGHSAAVNSMMGALAGEPASVLAIASDLPMLDGGEIDWVFEQGSGKLAILPSRDGTGTNGVLMHPAARIQMAYGEGSLQRHLQAAVLAGLVPGLISTPGIAFDVDTPEDLRDLVSSRQAGGYTGQYLDLTRLSGKLMA